MIGLISSQAYNSILNITEQIYKFEFYKFPDHKSGNVSYEKVRDGIEKDLEISDITATDIQDFKKAPIVIEENREQVTERMKYDGYVKFSAGYIRYIFQDFESYLRTEVDLVEGDIRLAPDENNSNFIISESQPGI